MLYYISPAVTHSLSPISYIYLQMSKTRERAATKEHSTQSKILDLETQLSRTTSEINQMRRSKEEVKASNRGLLKNCVYHLSVGL